jgi:hypothetical protein
MDNDVLGLGDHMDIKTSIDTDSMGQCTKRREDPFGKILPLQRVAGGQGPKDLSYYMYLST